MKPIYTRLFITSSILLLSLLHGYKTEAQCPFGGVAGNTAYDTTIKFGSGIVKTQVKFPKFDPQEGMVTCVKLCVTIKGIIDTVALENYTNVAQIGSYSYIRNDTITGPGIPTYLTSNATVNSSLFPLGPTDGTPGSGPDFYSQGPDTVLSRVVCSTISDSAAIVPFYGVNDSVTYDYTVSAILNEIVTGGSALKFTLSSALVNFHFEYCTCPAAVLPLNVRNFIVNKTADNEAKLTWYGFDDPNNTTPYHYVTEISGNGSSFSSFGQVPGSNQGDKLYDFIYTNTRNNGGLYYFRIKQVYANGYVRFSEVRQLKLEGSASPKFIIYPNPSDGIVGIKFDNNQHGKMLLQIFNTQGQKMMQKEIDVVGSYFQQIAPLKSGSYWLRLTDVTTQLSGVNQLIIK